MRSSYCPTIASLLSHYIIRCAMMYSDLRTSRAFQIVSDERCTEHFLVGLQPWTQSDPTTLQFAQNPPFMCGIVWKNLKKHHPVYIFHVNFQTFQFFGDGGAPPIFVRNPNHPRRCRRSKRWKISSPSPKSASMPCWTRKAWNRRWKSLRSRRRIKRSWDGKDVK